LMNIFDYIKLEDIVNFTQRLVQTPSESGQEKAVAQVIAREMKRLAFDEVQVDALNNVIGRLKGDGTGPSLLLNGHIDHAEPGAMPEPYSGKIMDGSRFGVPEPVLYGRGAVDMKGAIACMVYAAAAMKKAGMKLKGDVIVAGNPFEEESAAQGVLYMLDHDNVKADYAICGEATNLNVYVGHRGNAEVKITVKGRMSHASNPGRGVNAVVKGAELITYLLQHYRLPKHDLLGDCTVTILDFVTHTTRKAPVVPDCCEIYVDRRFLPGETQEQILQEFRALIKQAQTQISDLDAEPELTKWGIAFYTPPEELIVQKLRVARRKVMGEGGELAAWVFGTDGAFVADRGIPTVGFGPGDEYFAHTPEDHLPISHLEIATKVYAQTILEVCG